MSISLRSIRLLMQEVLPDKKISEDAVRMVRIHLEREVKGLTAFAAEVHKRENEFRRAIGDPPKVILSNRHMDMAIQGKMPALPEDRHDRSED